MHLIDPTRQRIRPIRNEKTGEVIGHNTDHWTGRTDALVAPRARLCGQLRRAVNEHWRPRNAADLYRRQGMAITASGMFLPTLRDVLDTTQLAVDVDSDTFDVRLISDSATPDFDTHDLWADLSANEISGTGYTADGIAITNFAMAISSGALTFDGDDSAWAGSTLSNVMAAVWVDDTLTSDPLLVLFDFVSAVSTTSGTLTVQYAAPAVSIDLTP